MTEILITSSVLIAAILVLRRLLRGRVNPRLQYALWLLVALRLLVPFSVPAATSVMNTRPAEAVQQAVSQTLPQSEAPAAQTEQSPTAPLPEAATSQPQPAEAAPAQPVNWLKVVWLGGAALVGAYFAVENLRFYARLKKQRRPLEGTDCPLPVYLAGDIPSPCLFGLVRLAVYVTPQAAENPQMLAHVLRHEHCHFRQGDHLWSLVRILCLAVYWFDPLVWAAALCSRTDCELACDRLVTRQLDRQERVAYGRTLVELVQHRQRLAYLACTATTMAAKPSHTKARVAAVLKSPKTALPALLAVVLCVAALLGCTFTGQSGALPTEEEVTALLHKAEAVYQMGNDELLEIVSYEEMFTVEGVEGPVYYDEIGNYDQTVADLFTQQGLAQLEKSCYFGFTPVIRKEDGKVYRASGMDDSAATRYYDTVSAVELLEQEDGRFTYQISHTAKTRWEETEDMTSRLVLVRQKGKLLVESFDYPLISRLEKFDELWERNADIVGWVEIPNTQLSCPVMQTEDNSYYENHNFYGDPDTYGVPFADYRVSPGSSNTIIYGNNMNDGQMFAELLNYKQLAYYKQHPTFRYDSLVTENTCKIIGVFLISENDTDFVYRDMINMSEQELAAYISQVRARSLIETGVDVNTSDRLVTLSTRDYSFKDENGDRTASIVVVGRAQRSDESAAVDTSAATLNAAPVMPEKWYEQILSEQTASQTGSNNITMQPGVLYALTDGQASGFPSKRTEAGQDELDRWEEIIHAGSISRFDGRTMGEQGGIITAEQGEQILLTLQNARLGLLESMGNPSTGGQLELVAYDAAGAEQLHCLYDGSWFTVQFAEEPTAYVFDGSVAGWSELEALLSAAAQSSGQPLDEENAQQTINVILQSFVVTAEEGQQEGAVSFSIPASLPQPPQDVALYATLNLTYSTGAGSSRVDSLLDWATGWQPGQQYSARWQQATGEKLVGVMLRMAYMTDQGDQSFREYAAGYTELSDPIPFGQSATLPKAELTAEGQTFRVGYTAADGGTTEVSMTLPRGTELVPDDGRQPLFKVYRNGAEIGSLKLIGYGTTAQSDLQSVDPAGAALPMQIYSPIALANHVDYQSGYRVVEATATASRAVCRMRYQSLGESAGSAANAPWLEQDCILAFDLAARPMFVAIQLAPDTLPAAELEAWAKTISFAQ